MSETKKPLKPRKCGHRRAVDISHEVPCVDFLRSGTVLARRWCPICGALFDQDEWLIPAKIKERW